MKILIVVSGNCRDYVFERNQIFVYEQIEAIVHSVPGWEYRVFAVRGKGLKGYRHALSELKQCIKQYQPDIIHAHYGLCGLLANLQRKVPVVTTYHGSDINVPTVMRLSKIAMRLSAWNIFVSKRTQVIAYVQVPQKVQRKSVLVPCGINMPKAAEELPNMAHVLEQGKRHVLFAGAFDNKVKDPALAKEVIALLNEKREAGNEKQVQLIELKGYSRDEVNALMYACDAFLMTSKTEGSPQVIKEAMACGCPMVSVDVGDVKERLCVPRTEKHKLRNESEELLPGCYVAETREVEELAGLLAKALAYDKRTEGRRKIEEDGLRNEDVAKQIMSIYLKLSKMGRRKR